MSRPKQFVSRWIRADLDWLSLVVCSGAKRILRPRSKRKKRSPASEASREFSGSIN